MPLLSTPLRLVSSLPLSSFDAAADPATSPCAVSTALITCRSASAAAATATTTTIVCRPPMPMLIKCRRFSLCSLCRSQASHGATSVAAHIICRCCCHRRSHRLSPPTPLLSSFAAADPALIVCRLCRCRRSHRLPPPPSLSSFAVFAAAAAAPPLSSFATAAATAALIVCRRRSHRLPTLSSFARMYHEEVQFVWTRYEELELGDTITHTVVMVAAYKDRRKKVSYTSQSKSFIFDYDILLCNTTQKGLLS
jgi:hypothetical protein